MLSSFVVYFADFEARGSAVFKALYYKPEGRGYEIR
jgi:hypothetical protein